MLSVELRSRACGRYVVVVLRRELDIADAESTASAVAELAQTGLSAAPRGLMPRLLTVAGAAAGKDAPAASAARGGAWHAGKPPGLGAPGEGRCGCEGA